LDKTLLVERDVKLGDQIIGVLTAAGIQIEDALWVYYPQVEEWRLVLSTPLVDQKGSRDSYLQILNTLKKAGILEDLPLRRMSTFSPRDPVLRNMRAAFGLPGPSGFRSGARVGNYAFDEAYIYEGAIRIVRDNPQRGQEPNFRVIFSPYSGPGGAVPSREFYGETLLSEFLRSDLHIDDYLIEKILFELRSHGATSVPNVRLSTSQLRRLRLLPSSPHRDTQNR
jgi:hypothetical protein